MKISRISRQLVYECPQVVKLTQLLAGGSKLFKACLNEISTTLVRPGHWKLGDIFADCTITARRCRVWLWHGLLINIIIMQRLTRHVSGIRMTNRRVGSVRELGWVGVDRNLDWKVVAWKRTTGSRTTRDLLSRQSNPWPLHHQATHNIVDWC